MLFVRGDIVSLKDEKYLKGVRNPMYVIIILERVGVDLVKVCNLDGFDERILPMKALKHHSLKSYRRSSAC